MEFFAMFLMSLKVSITIIYLFIKGEGGCGCRVI